MGEVWSGVIASVVIGLFYWLAARSAKSMQGHGSGNPLVITAGVFGRGSLSNFQVFFFSLIVMWILAFYVTKEGTLVGLAPDVLYLLGIAAAGTIGAKVAAVARQRLSFANWAWLKRKKWIEDRIVPAPVPPVWTDLITSEGTFDAYKFQTLIVSFIVGVSLVRSGLSEGATAGLASFTIPPTLLQLLGVSQAVNVAGKATSPPTILNLDAQLSTVRVLEGKFVGAVAKAWEQTMPAATRVEDAIKVAPAEYNAFLVAVKDAEAMVQERRGTTHPFDKSPELPKMGL